VRGYSAEIREAIYDRSDGRCHLCRRRLAFANYGRTGRRGAWHVDHSRARARGGVDDGRNFYAACVSCNCSKQDQDNRSVRRAFGYTRAPLSRRRRQEARVSNAILGGGATWLIARAALAAGPALGLALVVAAFAWELDPDGE
jgi:HNH endonuclease